MNSNRYISEFNTWDSTELEPCLGHNRWALTRFKKEDDSRVFCKLYELLENKELRLYILYSQDYNLDYTDDDKPIECDVEATHTFHESDFESSLDSNKEYYRGSEDAVPLEIPLPVTEVYVKCQGFHIHLPKSVRKVVIDRMPVDGLSIKYCDPDVSTFTVDQSNPYLYATEDGTLYSKEDAGKGKSLIFLHTTNGKVNIPDDVTDIRPCAVYSTKNEKLDIPSGVTIWRTAAIGGRFKSITFKGQLKTIENGAFNELDKNDGLNGDGKIHTELRINSLLSEINYGNNSWFDFIPSGLFFSAPKAKGMVDPKSGLLILTEKLSREEAVKQHGSSTPLVINPYSLNLSSFAKGDLMEACKTQGVLSAVEKVTFKDFYDGEVSGSKLIFANNVEIIIYVMEDPLTVNRLIGDALTKGNAR